MPGSLINQSEATQLLETFYHKSFSPIAEFVATTAINRALRLGHLYKFDSAPVSSLSTLSGNKIPERTPIKWLENKNKCNQFIGDIFSEAGISFPTYTMSDGTKHFVHAERLIKEKRYFDRIINQNEIYFGDLVIFDHSKVGENGAHVEIVTGLGTNGEIFLTGARANGASESMFPNLFKGMTLDRANERWNYSEGSLYILRPKYY